MFSDDFINLIRHDCDIISLVSSYTSIVKKGCNYMGLCPFHSEKTPSFCVYSNTNSFYCFGCGVGGDVITFVMLAENLQYKDAIEFLANKLGIPLPEEGSDNMLDRKSIFEINRAAARFFFSNLVENSDSIGLNYLRSRGVSSSTIKHFGLGYSPATGNSLVNHLLECKFSEKNIIDANLGVKSKNFLRDRFINRIIFPIIDTKGNIIAFGARSLNNNLPKYLNTSDTLVFKKSNNLFALNFAKKEKYFILTEGYMDVVSLHQLGFKSAVASLGTSLTMEQAKLISRYTNQIYLCYDSDDAGRKATDRAIEILENQKLIVKIIKIENAKDPDEFIKINGSNSKVKFQHLIEKSQNSIEFKISKSEKKYDINNTEEKVLFLKKLSDIISKIVDPIEKDVYLSKICSKYGISRDAFGLSVEKKNQKIEKSTVYRVKNRKKSEKFKNSRIEEFLISYIMRNTDYVGSLDDFDSDDFSFSFNFKVLNRIRLLVSDGKNVNIGSISEGFSSSEAGEISRILNLSVANNVDSSEFLELVECFRRNRQIRNLRSSKDVDSDEILKLLDKLKDSKM